METRVYDHEIRAGKRIVLEFDDHAGHQDVLIDLREGRCVQYVGQPDLHEVYGGAAYFRDFAGDDNTIAMRARCWIPQRPWLIRPSLYQAQEGGYRPEMDCVNLCEGWHAPYRPNQGTTPQEWPVVWYDGQVYRLYDPDNVGSPDEPVVSGVRFLFWVHAGGWHDGFSDECITLTRCGSLCANADTEPWVKLIARYTVADYRRELPGRRDVKSLMYWMLQGGFRTDLGRLVTTEFYHRLGVYFDRERDMAVKVVDGVAREVAVLLVSGTNEEMLRKWLPDNVYWVKDDWVGDTAYIQGDQENGLEWVACRAHLQRDYEDQLEVAIPVGSLDAVHIFRSEKVREEYAGRAEDALDDQERDDSAARAKSAAMLWLEENLQELAEIHCHRVVTVEHVEACGFPLDCAMQSAKALGVELRRAPAGITLRVAPNSPFVRVIDLVPHLANEDVRRLVFEALWDLVPVELRENQEAAEPEPEENRSVRPIRESGIPY